MEINAYIEQASVEYPQGYATYITKYPTQDKQAWFDHFEADEVRQFGGEIYNKSDMLDMDKWANSRFWTFMAMVEYEYNKAFGK